jgi:ribonuclease BN (tRNA processing enzyme)
LKLHIVGSSPAVPRPGGASSSYLVRSAAAAVLLDFGTGAFAKLQLVLDPSSVDAIVVSHMHADHFFDLVPLRYALKYGSLSPGRLLPIWLPPGGRTSLDALRRAVSPDASEDFFDCVFAVREYDPEVGLEVRDVTLRFAPSRHYIEAYAMRCECDGTAIAYSGDTAPCDSVVQLARSSALFLCEAGLGLGTEDGERGHSSAQEAGDMAARAGASRLLLTHYSAAYPANDLVIAASSAFGGPVASAEDGMDVAI